MPKTKLELDFFSSSAQGLGFYCDYHIFKLIFTLNEDLGLRLTRSANDFQFKRKGLVFNFKTFSYTQPSFEVDWFLTENKGESISGKREEKNGFFDEIEEQVKWVNTNENYNYFLWSTDENVSSRNLDETRNNLAKLDYVKACNILGDNILNKIEKNLN